jgi:hypothetical protein
MDRVIARTRGRAVLTWPPAAKTEESHNTHRHKYEYGHGSKHTMAPLTTPCLFDYARIRSSDLAPFHAGTSRGLNNHPLRYYA